MLFPRLYPHAPCSVAICCSASNSVFGSHLVAPSHCSRVSSPPCAPLPGLPQGQRGATATRLLYPTCRRHCHAPGGRVLLSEGLKHIQAGNDLSQT